MAVSVRAPIFVSALAATAALGLSDHRAGSEPRDPAAAVRSAIDRDKSADAPAQMRATRHSTRTSENVASATRHFDLKAVTLADFGDVER